MSEERDARLLGSGAHRRVELRRTLAHPIERVWNALVDPAAIACWFTDARIDAREGGELVLSFERTVVNATITVCTPPFVLAYRWRQEGEPDSLVSFDLIATGPRETVLTVVQTALAARDAGEVALHVERGGDLRRQPRRPG